MLLSKATAFSSLLKEPRKINKYGTWLNNTSNKPLLDDIFIDYNLKFIWQKPALHDSPKRDSEVPFNPPLLFIVQIVLTYTPPLFYCSSIISIMVVKLASHFPIHPKSDVYWRHLLDVFSPGRFLKKSLFPEVIYCSLIRGGNKESMSDLSILSTSHYHSSHLESNDL